MLYCWDAEYRKECRFPKGDSDEDIAPTGLLYANETYHHLDGVIIIYHPVRVTYLYKHGNTLHITVFGNISFGCECNEPC